MSPPPAQSRLQRSPWLLPAGIGAGVLADVAFDPVHHHVPLCPFKALTGWDCPLCGGLRAVDQFAHGHLAAALHANVLVMTLGPLLVLGYLYRVAPAAKPRSRRTPRWAIVGLVLVMVVFTVVRNIPAMQSLRPA